MFVVDVILQVWVNTMKASIGRLRRLTSHKVDAKEQGELVSTAQIDELDRAGKVNSSAFAFLISELSQFMYSRIWVFRNRRDFSRVYYALWVVRLEFHSLLDRVSVADWPEKCQFETIFRDLEQF